MGAVAASIGLTVVFATSLVGSVLLHLNTAPTRRTATLVANRVFADLFRGKLVIGGIDRLSLSQGVTIASADAWDPSGARVVHAQILRVDADAITIAKSALLGTGDIAIHVPLVLLGDADVALFKGADGSPTIADVFLPRVPSPPAPPGPPGRGVKLTVDRVQIDHAWAHGDIAAPALDAEVAGAVGKVAFGADGLVVDLDPATVAARAPLPQPLGGNLTYHLTMGPQGSPQMNAAFDGRFGDVDVHTTAQLSGTHVAAHVEVPRVTAAAIASFVPGNPPTIPLRVPVSAVVDAEGDIPEIVFRTKLSFEGTGWASADGTLVLKAPLTVDVGVAIHDVDPRVALDLPSATPVSADAHVWIEAGASPRVDATATTKPFMLAGNVIPAASATVTLAKGRWLGAFQVSEIGAPLHGTFTADPATQDVAFEVDTTVASLRKIARVAIPVDGGGSVKVKGTLDHGKIDARVSARVSGIRAPGAVALESAGVDARFTGPIDKPTALNVDATVWGSGLQAGFYSYEKVTAHATGPLLSPHVEAKLDAGAGESLAASGTLDGKAQSMTDVRVRINRGGGVLEGRVARVAATPGGVKVDGIALEGGGIGELTGGLFITGKELTGKLRGENVDLEKVSHLASYPGHLAGLANVDIELSSSGPGHRKGHVAIEIVNGEAAILKGISGVFTATFEDDKIRTDALLRVVAHAADNEVPGQRCDGAIAQLRITGGEGRLPGPLLDPASWRKAWGHIEVAADEWNLRCIRRLVPPFVPVPEMRGKLTTRVTVERAPGKLPVLKSFFARTLGLSVTSKDWVSAHTDLELTGALDPTTGEAKARLAILDEGTLGALSVETKLDVPGLVDHPDTALDAVRKAPMHVRFEVPRRPVTAFAGLPTFVTRSLPLLTGEDGETVGGDLQLDATLEGALDDPRFEAKLKTYRLAHVTIVPTEMKSAAEKAASEKAAGEKAGAKPAGAKPADAPRPPVEPVLGTWGLPADLDAVLRYDGQKATLDATVANEGHIVTRAKGDIGLALKDLLQGHVRPSGSVHLGIEGLPVGDVPFFADRDIAGHLSGKLAMESIGDKPSLSVELHMDGLKIGRDLAYERATVSLDVAAPRSTPRGERSASRLAVELAGTNAGRLATTVTNDVSWDHGIVPMLDQEDAVKLDLTAEHFNIAVAQPFLASVVSRMDGLLDGKSRVQWSFGAKEQASRVDDVSFKLSRGVFNLPALGQELHDVSLEIAGAERGMVKLLNLHAEGPKGLLTGSGFAQFDGLLFKKAELGLAIDAKNALAVTLEGLPIGDASGEIKLSADARKGGGLDLKVGIPNLHLDLAAALGRSVQSSDDNTDVTLILGARPPDAPKAVVANTPKTVITFDPVNISLKGKLLGKVPLEAVIRGAKDAPLRVELGGKKPKITGVLYIPLATIEVLHKQFQIENGSIKLNPDDPARSFVNATARYDAPDASQIFVDFVGEASPMTPDKLKDKLKCRSANLSQERCFSALVVGPDQGNSGGAAQGQTLATQLIASEFDTDIGGGFSTSIGTTDDGSIRPGVQYNAGKAVIELSTYGATGTGSTTTAAGGSASKGQHSLLTVDWRFWRNWSMRGKVDIGSDAQTYGADVLWQYRY
jgi:translocation and assembly module TamB